MLAATSSSGTSRRSPQVPDLEAIDHRQQAAALVGGVVLHGAPRGARDERCSTEPIAPPPALAVATTLSPLAYPSSRTDTGTYWCPLGISQPARP